MVWHRWRESRPGLNSRHYSPNTKQPNSSPRRLVSAESSEERKRSARSKNAFSLALRASRPSSINSIITRLSLSLLRRAMLATFRAVDSERLTLRRTCLVVFTAPSYTILVYRAFTFIKSVLLQPRLALNTGRDVRQGVDTAVIMMRKETLTPARRDASFYFPPEKLAQHDEEITTSCSNSSTSITNCDC